MLYPWQITEISCHSFHLVQCTRISYIVDIKETLINIFFIQLSSSPNPTSSQKKSVGERIRTLKNKTACLDLLAFNANGVHYFETSPFSKANRAEILFHWKGSILPVQNISMNLPEAFLVEANNPISTHRAGRMGFQSIM